MGSKLHINRRHCPAPREANDKTPADVNGSTFKPQARLNLRSVQVVVCVFPFTLYKSEQLHPH